MTLAIDLAGKTILVCGCHRGGIGGAVARQVARAGGAVVLLDKDRETVEATAAEVRALGGTAHTMVADLYDVTACEAVIARVLEQAREVMAAALEQGGTSFDALYVNVNGASGYFDRSLNAYGQAERPCPRCGTPIRREAFMNRGSFSCPRCQPRPRSGRS
jgi:NAD(P)-dependent dehydrogenase (short-subunit alcohol dehydrogenase family)